MSSMVTNSDLSAILPVVLHIPHSSRIIPSDIRHMILLSDSELENELKKMTDSFTDGKPLRCSPTNSERETLINRYYRPHHLKFEKNVSASLHRYGKCLIIDCHSFPSAPLPYEDDQRKNRPDICIGIDELHTPVSLCQAVEFSVKKLGLSCAINRPFSGSIVPSEFYRKNLNIISIMIEINRRLYMHENTGEKSCKFSDCKESIQSIIQIIQRWRRCLNSFTPVILS